MRAPIVPALALMLSACDSPSPAFMDAPAIPVEVAGSAFSVRIKNDRAEATRTTSEWAPSLAAIASRAVAAIEQASGCLVEPGSLEGDAAVVRAALDCDA